MGSSSVKRKTKSSRANKTNEEPQAQTKEQIKAELKRRGLKTSGNKTELQQRLENSFSSSMSGVSRRTKSDPQVNGSTKNKVAMHREELKKERAKLVLWRRPFLTLYYATLEMTHFLRSSLKKMMQHRVLMTMVLLLTAAIAFLFNVQGPHQKVIEPFLKQMWWCTYWVGLGVLSSVGLGTGLHTFLLYLGPHIASVTLAAYECHSLDFPAPPYPDEIVCPDHPSASWEATTSVWSAVLAIMAKVRLEAFMWGAGTALGELPPYFMARAARLSGGTDEDEDDDDELRDFEELQRKQQNHEEMTIVERTKLGVEKLVEKVGFFGILACASIPNPLFDLAGITCGHFLVPFWTFFGATLIGKAVIKMHIQKLFVIIAFNEPLVEAAVTMLARVPYIGPKVQEPFKEFLARQKSKLHRKVGAKTSSDGQSGSLLASLFEKLVILMVFYFVISIVNSLAQAYHKRIHKQENANKVATD
ncbi:vacuole membrane protein 1 isoform X2 [Neocloeon triangulifer]|uniref:vacuole membrane protein 1 isoform X2 n=1 Tax=Neocloeon triangulifer TaxID=2078957 RepID=UPI00286ED4AE|nr:vacuole membrane protein 1 isoform X2 [Neocloeon triangulifer]